MYLFVEGLIICKMVCVSMLHTITLSSNTALLLRYVLITLHSYYGSQMPVQDGESSRRIVPYTGRGWRNNMTFWKRADLLSFVTSHFPETRPNAVIATRIDDELAAAAAMLFEADERVGTLRLHPTGARNLTWGMVKIRRLVGQGEKPKAGDDMRVTYRGVIPGNTTDDFGMGVGVFDHGNSVLIFSRHTRSYYLFGMDSLR